MKRGDINLKISLASTLHDPENRLKSLIVKYGPLIKKNFREAYIITTPNTHTEIIKKLTDLKFETSIGSKTIIGTYKKALKNSLSNNPDQVFYCDFDRILHWIKTYPDELKVVDRYFSHDFILFGRTSRAFKTHPETQTMTESLVNLVASKILGFEIYRDIISTCWRFEPRIVKKLLSLLINNVYGLYCKWPVMMWMEAKNPLYLEVEGLEWETSDRYQAEIRDRGYLSWLKEFKTPEEWKRRVKILKDSIESIFCARADVE